MYKCVIFLFFLLCFNVKAKRSLDLNSICRKGGEGCVLFADTVLLSSEDEVLSFLHQNDFSLREREGSDIVGVKKFSFYKEDSISYEVVYRLDKKKYRVRFLGIHSKKYKTVCDIERNSDYSILLKYYSEKTFLSLFPTIAPPQSHSAEDSEATDRH